MIYSPKGQPELPKNKGAIFYMGEVSELWRKTMVNMLFFRVVLKSRTVIEKANAQARVSERLSHVFNLSSCSVVFKM